MYMFQVYLEYWQLHILLSHHNIFMLHHYHTFTFHFNIPLTTQQVKTKIVRLRSQNIY